MKRFIFALFLLFFSFEVSAEELRGVWLRPPSNVEEIPIIMKDLEEAGFNAAFVETFYHGFTVSASSPIPTRPEFEGKDVLQMFIDEGKKRGIGIHAWVEVFYWEVQTEKYPQFPKTPLFDGHPDWVSKLKGGRETWESEPAHRFANPAHPEVRSLLLDYFKNMLENYDLAGINLDYIRYCSWTEDAGYDDFTVNKFKKEMGFDPSDLVPDDSEQWKTWCEWREKQVTEFVEQVHKMKEETKPEVLLSAAVFSGYYRERFKSHFVFQDWGDWGKRNLIDGLTPMAYGQTVQGITSEIKEAMDIFSSTELGKKVKMYPGLAISRDLKDGYSSEDHPPMKDQIEGVRELGVSGNVIFCYEWIKGSKEGLEAFKEIYQK